MIQTILEKILGELGQEKPDLSYIRGMVEVLLASQIPNAPAASKPIPAGEPGVDILEARARAAVETIKALNQESPNPELPK